jgi:hypothetical protein
LNCPFCSGPTIRACPTGSSAAKKDQVRSKPPTEIEKWQLIGLSWVSPVVQEPSIQSTPTDAMSPAIAPHRARCYIVLIRIWHTLEDDLEDEAPFPCIEASSQTWADGGDLMPKGRALIFQPHRPKSTTLNQALPKPLLHCSILAPLLRSVGTNSRFPLQKLGPHTGQLWSSQA